jgi:putative ABC transport system permease protein
MMISDNLMMALGSIRSSRLRSFLTLLGVIIGVTSVITSVSLAEGVKRQISEETNKLGNDVLTIRPGKILSQDQQGFIVGINSIGGATTTATLTEADLKVVRNTPGVESSAVMNLVTGLPTYQKEKFNNAITIGTTPELPEMLSQEVEFGRFFNNSESEKKVAVIGKNVAEDLFDENVPLSKSFKFRGHEFVVYGIFERFESASFSQGIDFNNAIFIPYDVAKSVSGGSSQLYGILARVDDENKLEQVSSNLKKGLVKSHAGQEDFSILKPEDTRAVTNNIINLITAMIAGIAAISMLVGGIGIMNVMLVSVTERTREIGLRKAVGATNRQIMSQFMIEATVLSVWGAMIGVALSGLINLGIRIFTNLQPVIAWEVIVFATTISVIIGIVFGLAPAVKAARKDPIDALRANLF